jgi:hypothetical protein
MTVMRISHAALDANQMITWVEKLWNWWYSGLIVTNMVTSIPPAAKTL